MERHATTFAPTWKSSTFLNWSIALLILAVFAYLIAPELHEYRTGPRRRLGISNQLKMVALAMHNYHDTYGAFPRAAWIDDQGVRSHSWRVQLLPFMEQEAAYEYFAKGPPPQATETVKWRREVAPLFRDPADRSRPLEQTSIMVITGPGTMFEEGKDLTFRDCTDGSSNTILAIEVRNSGVNWDAPVDLDVRTMLFRVSAGEQFGLGNAKGTGTHVALADGSVRFLTNEMIESTLRAMITRAGGEMIDQP